MAQALQGRIGVPIRVGLLGLVLLLVAGCAGTSAPAPASAPARTDQPAAPRAIKTLRIGTTREPTTGIVVFRGEATGELNPPGIFHSALTFYDAQGNLIPRLAESVPTIENGGWVVDPDGTMRVTWKLRSGVRWHDGAPLTVDDLMLGIRVAADPEVPTPKNAWATNVESIQPVDDQTMTVHWRRSYFLANVAGPDDLTPLPHHLLGETYDSGNKQALINNSYWTRDFVGLGPYQLTGWTPGSELAASAFDGYFLGRPKIDRLQIRLFSDTNTLVASLLAGEIDYVPIGALKVDQLATLQPQWEQMGAGTIIRSSNGLRMLFLQYRDPSMPWVGDLRVRQALLETLERQTLVDTLQHGMTTVAHTLPTPNDPIYPMLEQKGLRKYPFDQRHAQELLGQSGWTKDGEGRYRSAQGQPFPFEIRTVATAPETLQEIVALSDMYKAAGFDSSPFPIQLNASNRSELRAQAPGVFDNYISEGPDTLRDFTSTQIATEANGWRGRNVWGYADQGWDQTYQRYTETLSLGPRQSILVDLLKRAADELIFLPLWYYPGTTNVAVRKGLQGPGPIKSSFQCDTWNIETWELS